MNHEKLEIRQVTPDEDVLYTLQGTALSTFQELYSLRKETLAHMKAMERNKKRMDALSTLMWDKVYDHVSEENVEAGMTVCGRGDEFVVILSEDAHEGDNDACDCPACSSARSGDIPDIIKRIADLLNDHL